MEAMRNAQDLKKVLPPKEFNHLFENKRYTNKLTGRHLCRKKVRWRGLKRVKEETVRGFCLLSSKNANKPQKLGTSGGSFLGI